MYDTDIKSDIETNTYLHSNSSHMGVVCVKVCVSFSARLFCVLKSIKLKFTWLKVYCLTAKLMGGVRMQIFNSM